MSDEHPPKRGSGGEAPSRDISKKAAPAAIALRAEDLTLWVMERVAKMPRDHKFTAGDKLIETMLEVTTLLCEATFIHDKLPILLQASRALTRAQLLCRLAQRLHLLSMAQRDYFGDQCFELSRMLGGWTRAVRAR